MPEIVDAHLIPQTWHDIISFMRYKKNQTVSLPTKYLTRLGSKVFSFEKIFGFDLARHSYKDPPLSLPSIYAIGHRGSEGWVVYQNVIL